ILAAGAAMGPSADAKDDAALAKALKAIQPTEGLALEHKGARFFAPLSGDELAAVLEAHPDATVLAGGTDVGLWVTKQHRDLPVIVSQNEAADLRRIDEVKSQDGGGA